MPAPIAVTTILAQAFRQMEVTPPSSFDDDSDKARDAAEQYPDALLQCLEANDWSFASVLVNLPAAVRPDLVAQDDQLPYFYELPGDLVRVQEVGDGDISWRIDRDGLRADEPAPLRMRYTATLPDESRMPATFRNAVSLTLASLLAPRWVGTESKIARIDTLRANALKQAMAQDARTASAARYDGLPDQGDWVSEATL